MRAVQFNVTIPGFLVARSVGRLGERFRFNAWTGLRLRDLEDPPAPPPGWARLDVLGCGICGTDLGNLSYEASPILEPFGSFPAVLGHEILGRIESVGPGVRRVVPGDRVAADPLISCAVRGWSEPGWCASCRAGLHGTCEMAGEEGSTIIGGRPLGRGLMIGYHRDLSGGWCGRMLAHESQLFPLDTAIPNRAGVLVEPLSVCVHAVLNALPPAGEDVLVIGSGPIALGTVWALRAAGFGGAIVAQTKRAPEGELARLLGATDVVSPGEVAREALVETGGPRVPAYPRERGLLGGWIPARLRLCGLGCLARPGASLRRAQRADRHAGVRRGAQARGPFASLGARARDPRVRRVRAGAVARGGAPHLRGDRAPHPRDGRAARPHGDTRVPAGAVPLRAVGGSEPGEKRGPEGGTHARRGRLLGGLGPATDVPRPVPGVRYAPRASGEPSPPRSRFTASWRASKPSRAHFTLTGNFETP